MKRELYLYRHGQTDWNREGRIQGHLDVPLNDVGRGQAGRLIPHLQRLEVEAFLSSDLSRAEETARIAATALGVPVFTDAGLREVFFGEVQGLTAAEIEAKKGIQFSQKLRHHPLSDQELLELGGETGPQVVARALASLDRFFREHPRVRRFAVVSHGGTIRRLLMHIGSSGFPPPIPNGSLFPLSYAEGPGWTLVPTLPLI